ncbi:MAG: hypothetical protein ACOX2K_05800 [Bacillota bacterium]|jgi:hypothetical protein
MNKLRVLASLVVMCLVMPSLALAAQPNSIILTGQDATVPAGSEVENVVVIAGDAHISGRVTETVVTIGGSIFLQPGAEVYGDAVCIGGQINLEGDARIGGQQVSIGSFSLDNLRISPIIPFLGNWLGFGFSIWRLVSVVFLGAVVYWLFPLAIKRSSSALSFNPAKSVMFGLLGYLALIPMSILLVITILGIPLVPILWLLVAAGRLFGQVALAMIAGQWLVQQLRLPATEINQVLLGLIGLGLLTVLPIVGSMASLFYGLAGFGAVLWTRFGTLQIAIPKE